MSATASWGRRRPLAVGEQRFVPREKKFGRTHSMWQAYDVLTASYPAAIPGFGLVPQSKSKAECEALCARLAEFHEGKTGVGR